MRKLLIVLSGIVLTLTACQKERSLETDGSTPGGGNTGGGGGGGNQTLGLLTRLVDAAGPDSSVKEYSYDAANRLVNFRLTDTDPDLNASSRIVRNSAGVITRFVIKSPTLTFNGIDSIARIPVYNSAQSRYTHSIGQVTLNSVPYIDSTAYSYDGAGNLTGKTSFIRTTQSPYIPIFRYEYTYVGSNLVSQKIYAASGTNGAMELGATFNYTYDNKVGPLRLGPEALIVLDDDVSLYGNNNPASVNFIDASDPNNTYTFNYTYNYNTLNKPITGTATRTPGGGTRDVRYYYN